MPTYNRIAFRATVTTTPAALTASDYPARTAIYIKALSSNTQVVSVNVGSTSDATNGVPLAAGDEMIIKPVEMPAGVLCNAKNIFAIAASGTQYLSVRAV